jgi:hypothetical protein
VGRDIHLIFACPHFFRAWITWIRTGVRTLKILHQVQLTVRANCKPGTIFSIACRTKHSVSRAYYMEAIDGVKRTPALVQAV